MSVNYLIEINALDDWELTHPLSATAYKVLRKLLYLANKERFPEKISVPNGVLMSLAGCSEDSLIKARNQLIQYGLISYKGQKKVTPVYMIAYFSNNPVYNSKKPGYEQGIKPGYEQGIKPGYEQGNQQGTYINKIYGEEGEEGAREPAPAEDPGENAIAYFRKCGIAMQASQYEAIRDFYECGITDDMLCYAADEAVEYGKLNFAYIRRVVDNWICSGIRTLAAAKERQRKFKQDQAGKAAHREPVNPAPPPTGPRPSFFRDRRGNE